MTKVYRIEDIRNIALLGHSGSGKTSLAEAMLFNTGAINRQGKVEEGNTVSDYGDEEINRTISINASVIPVEWKDAKINAIDAPGYLDFVGEVIGSLMAVNVAVLVLDGVSGVEVGTILSWRNITERDMPKVVFVNKMDRDNASYRQVIDELGQKFDGKFVPMEYPIRRGETFEGVVDLITRKAYTGIGSKATDAPAELTDEIETFRLEMVEAAAEGDDDLMMKYFEGEELTEEDIAFGLKQGIKEGTLVPVFCGSATNNVGVRPFMDSIFSILPFPRLSL